MDGFGESAVRCGEPALACENQQTGASAAAGSEFLGFQRAGGNRISSSREKARLIGRSDFANGWGSEAKEERQSDPQQEYWNAKGHD